jgi:hypothetical protein
MEHPTKEEESSARRSGEGTASMATFSFRSGIALTCGTLKTLFEVFQVLPSSLLFPLPFLKCYTVIFCWLLLLLIFFSFPPLGCEDVTLPYWDLTAIADNATEALPKCLTQKEFTFSALSHQPCTIPNPLRSYTLPVKLTGMYVDREPDPRNRMDTILVLKHQGY